MPSDQQDYTLNKQSIGMLQHSLTVAVGRALLAFSVFLVSRLQKRPVSRLQKIGLH